MADDMSLLWLPKRSPEFNLIEPFWGQGKDMIAAHKQYETIEEQVDRFIEYIIGLSGPDTLHTSGVLSDNFWLRHSLSRSFAYLLVIA
jgi:hypothetical protein